jgi:hypothetical protein
MMRHLRLLEPVPANLDHGHRHIFLYHSRLHEPVATNWNYGYIILCPPRLLELVPAY